MTLSRNNVDSLLKMISLTKEKELTCGECADRLSEFAEINLAGKSVSDGLKAVEHHLALCQECCEEFEALMDALRGG